MSRIFSIAVPAAMSWQPQRAFQFIDQFLFSFPQTALRIVAQPNHIEWQVAVLDEVDTTTVERAIQASYPEATVTQLEVESLFRTESKIYRYLCKYQPIAETFLAPIKHVQEIKDSDPLASVIAAMGKLQSGEKISYTLFVFGMSEEAYKTGESQLYRNVSDSLLTVLFPNKVQIYRDEIHRVLVQKLETKLFQCLAAIQIDTPVAERIGELMVIDSQMVLFDREQFNGLRRYDDTAVYEVSDDPFDFETSIFGLFQKLQAPSPSREVKHMRQALGLVLEPREITALWHLPHEGFRTPGIVWAKSDHPMSDQVAQVSEGLALGTGIYQGKTHPVFWQHSQRGTHLTIVGKSGTGKSNFLHTLVHQDIHAGRGVVVIDPHGNKPDSLFRRLLHMSIPEQRAEDVVVIDLADSRHPPPLNLLAMSKTNESANGAGEVIALMERVYEDMEATRWRDTLANLLFTLWQDDAPTLLDVDRLFSDSAYRARLVARIGIENYTVRQFWDGFERLSELAQQNLRQPVTYRLRTLIGNPHLLPMLCHPQMLNFGDLIANNRIILISLGVDSQVVPETEQNLLAALLIAAFEKAAFARRSQDIFPIYIDEAQRFGVSSLAKVFAEVRKSGVAFTLAHQYLRQLPEKVRDAVFGNVGAIVAFQTSPEDAVYLAKYMRPAFDGDDLIQMDKFQAAAWLRQSDKTQPAFALTPLAPITPPLPSTTSSTREQQLRQRSIQRYTSQTKDDILRWIKERYMPAQAPTKGSEPIPPDSSLYG